MLYSLLAAVFAALAVIFGIYDLQISNEFVNAESAFGLAMELSGMLVAPYLFIAAGIIISVYSHKSTVTKYKKSKIAIGIVLAFGGICFCSYIYVQLGRLLSLLAFVLTGIAFGFFVVFLRRKSCDELYELLKIAVVTIVYLLAVLAVINIIKIFWGRVRFREMTDPSQYSPWYLPQGINGHKSFPSGHTSNAATLYVVTMLAPLCKKYWQRFFCYAVPVLWIIVMAISRVLVGAHFCSDVLFGGLISVGLFYLTRKLVLARFAKIC